jgi:hypothetical protein
VGIYADLQRGRLAFFLNGHQIAPARTDPDLLSCSEPLYPTVVPFSPHVLSALPKGGARLTSLSPVLRRSASEGRATEW